MKKWHAAALLLVIVAATYYPVISAPLNTLDDLRMVHDLANRQPSIGDFLFHPYGSYFRPVVLSTWLVDKSMWDLEASFMHLENLLLHIFNVLLVFLLAVRSMQGERSKAVLPAFLAALLFGLHPINTEAIAWIAGRADLLAGLFSFLTILIILAWRESPRYGLLAAGLFSFLLGCLSKETGLFVLPALFYLVLVVRTDGSGAGLSGRQKLVFSLGFLAVVGIYFGWRHQVLYGADYGLHHTAEVLGVAQETLPTEVGSEPGPQRSLPELLWYLSAVGGFYLRKLFFPWPLNFGINHVPLGFAWLGLLLWGASAWAVLQRRLYVVLWLAGLGTLGAALLVAAGDVSWVPVAERYMYLPCGTFALLIAIGLSRWRRVLAAKPLLTVVVTLCLSTAAWGAWQRTLLWQDNVELYRDTLKKSPRLDLARNQLAAALLQRGEQDQAMALFQGLKIAEDKIGSLNQSLAMVNDGDLAGARAFLLRRLKTPYTFEIEILHRLVRVLEQMIDETDDSDDKAVLYREGIVHLDRLWELTHNPFYWYRIGQYQMFLDDRNAARKSFLRAYRGLAEDSMYKEPARKLAEAMVD